MKFITSVLSNIGGRNKNDDYAGYIYRDNSYGAWIVADGLGGHVNGEVASKIAVETALNSFQLNKNLSKTNIESVLNHANLDIINAQINCKATNGMRTTIVSLFTDSKEVVWAHVGDSRLYFFKNGVIKFQTRDHSVSQMAVSSGEIYEDQIRFHEDRNKLIRVLGSSPELKVDVLKNSVQINPGDSFLLCTDGFWELIYETEMEIDFCKSNSPDEWIKFMRERLIKRASGEHDNFTAIAIFVQ